MERPAHYVGLDVHKETIAVAVSDQVGRATSLGTIPNTADALARLMRRLQQKATLSVCYEAGACGYVVYRQLAGMGIDCVVVAPTLIPVKSGDRVKTNRRDAIKLARYLRAGELVAVWVPDEAQRLVARMDAAVLAQAVSLPEPMQRVVSALVCFHGVAELTAVTVTAEAGDLGRFAKAAQLFSYAGLVPSEHSSGGPDKTRRGGITKAGNAHLRKAIVESAWHYRHAPRAGAAVRKRRAGKDPVVVELAQKAHRRLHGTYHRLLVAGKPPAKAAVAVGRELLGFMWAIARQVNRRQRCRSRPQKQPNQRRKTQPNTNPSERRRTQKSETWRRQPRTTLDLTYAAGNP